MATIGIITITLDSLCAADNHVRVILDLERGEKVITLSGALSELIGQALDQDDIEAFFRVLLKLGSRGRTRPQLKSLLQEGVTITISA